MKKYLLNRHRTNLGQNLFIIGPSISLSWRVLGPSWTDVNFFLPPSGRLLGPSGRGPGPPGGLPGGSWRLLILVKRTILKIHLPSFCILGPIFSTCSSFEHQYTSRSIQLHLGNAVCHMSDPLPDPFFSIMIGPKTDLKKISPQQDAKKLSQDRVPGGWAMDRGEVHKTGIIRGSVFFFFFFFLNLF